MVRKVVIGIFIAIFVIFLMSHNASALSLDFNNYSLVNSYAGQGMSCRLGSGQTAPTGLTFCTFDAESNYLLLKEIQATKVFDFKKGDIIEYYFVVATTEANNLSGSNLYLFDTVNNNGLVTLNYELVDDYSNIEFYTFDNQLSTDLGYTLYDFYANYRVSKVYKITQYAPANGQYTIGFNVTSTSNNRFVMSWSQTRINDSVLFTFKNINIYTMSESKENKEQQQKTQEAVDQSTTDGNSSQTTVEGSTQSLMSAGGSIISALVNAPATDCNINVQTTGSSRLFTTAIGQLNLCSDVPQGVLNMVQGIVALVFTPIVLYFTYNVLTTLYNQFKEYNS